MTLSKFNVLSWEKVHVLIKICFKNIKNKTASSQQDRIMNDQGFDFIDLLKNIIFFWKKIGYKQML